MRELNVQQQRLRGQDREKKEGTEKCQSVQTCLGIWSRVGGERQRASKREKQGELRRNH